MTEDSPYRIVPPSRWPALVLFQALPDAGPLPLRTLCLATAEALVTDFNDDVCVLMLEHGGADRPPDARRPATGVVAVPRTSWPDATDAVVAAIRAHAGRYAYTFLDASALGGELTARLVEVLADTELAPTPHLRLVRFDRHAPGMPADDPHLPPRWRPLVVQLLPLDPDRSGANPRNLLRRVTRRLAEKIDPSRRVTTAARYPDAPVRTELVRVAMDARPGAGAAGNFSLLARAVSSRRVGLALGGSGAWGYAHAALIDRLTLVAGEVTDAETRDGFDAVEVPGGDVRVPVDLIAAASSGSLIGAYYAVHGSAGLRQVIASGERIEWAMLAAMVSSWFLEATIALDCGPCRLDETECLFFPVTANLSTMEAEYIVNAEVCWGARASGTAPGVFASTVAKDGVFVDGAIADNVPAVLVDHLGADLVVATNPLPPPENVRVVSPTNPLLRFLFEFSPLYRAHELISSFALMFHKVGEIEGKAYILYDPPPSAFPLIGTFDFSNGPKIYQQALREREFRRCVLEAKRAWKDLAAPRRGKP